MQGLSILSAGSTVYGARSALAAEPSPDGVIVATDHGHDIHHAVVAGKASADIVIIPADMLEDLDVRGLLDGGRRAIGETGIGYAVPGSRRAPALSDEATLCAAVRQADALYLTRAPTGEHMRACLVEAGLGDVLNARLRLFDRATEMLAALAQDAGAALAFGPTSELMAWASRGIAYGGRAPFAFDLPLRYDGAVLAASSRKREAHDLLDYLAGPGLAHFRASGVD